MSCCDRPLWIAARHLGQMEHSASSTFKQCIEIGELNGLFLRWASLAMLTYELRISWAIFSARASVKVSHCPIINSRINHSQIVATGCPGGKIGNDDASTTRSPFTPYTLALVSMTAFLSPSLPIAHVHAA